MRPNARCSAPPKNNGCSARSARVARAGSCSPSRHCSRLSLRAARRSRGEEERRYWADGWNGYAAARTRLVDFLAERKIANPVVLSGDIHAFLVNDVHRHADDASSPIVATELVTTSITSPSRPQRDFDLW